MGRVVTYLVLAALASTLVWAQNIDGTITGIVEDPSGARIAGVTVTAVNQVTVFAIGNLQPELPTDVRGVTGDYKKLPMLRSVAKPASDAI